MISPDTAAPAVARAWTIPARGRRWLVVGAFVAGAAAAVPSAAALGPAASIGVVAAFAFLLGLASLWSP